MRLMTVKRRQLTDLALLFTRNANPPRDPADNEESWRKFKYACGRNWQRCQHAIEETKRLQEEQKQSIPGYAAYQAAEELILDRYIEKTETGEPVFEKRDDEAYPVLRAGAQADFERDIKDLQAQEPHASVLAAMRAQASAIDAVLDQPVDLELFCVPWATVPERVSGTYTAELAVMLTGIPDEFLEKTQPVGREES